VPSSLSPVRRRISDPLALVVVGVWIVGFLVGTTTHILDLIVGGVAAYAGFPIGVRVFWIALTVLDPLTILLLLTRRRAAVVSGLAVIVADVAVNWTVFACLGGLSLFGVLLQTGFGVLLLVSAPVLWRASSE
jgi:hypothetical protein